LVAIAWALYQLSLSHLLGTCVLFLFFDAKARREEIRLAQTYPDYGDYRQRVKKFAPWLY
jgi:protein-S-isoprenylcysteine O-methyltransferase Ste14